MLINLMSEQLKRYSSDFFSDSVYKGAYELDLYYRLKLLITEQKIEKDILVNYIDFKDFVNSRFIVNKQCGFNSFVRAMVLKRIVQKQVKTNLKNKNILFVVKDSKFLKYIDEIVSFDRERVFVVCFEGGKDETRVDYFVQDQPYYEKYKRCFGAYIRGGGYLEYMKVLVEALCFDNIKKIVLVEGNWSVDQVCSVVAKSNGIESVCIQQGWNPNLNIQWQNLNFTKFLTWGDYFSIELKKVNGDFFVDFISCGSFKIKENKKSENVSVGFCAQLKNHIITDDVYDEFISSVVMIKEKVSNVTVYFRKHPSGKLSQDVEEKLTSCGVIMSDPFEEDLVTFFGRLKIMVSIYSSTLMESIAASVIPVVFSNSNMSRYRPDLERLRVGFEVRSQSELLEVVLDVLQKDDVYYETMRNIATSKKRFFHQFGEKSLHEYTKQIFN
jgi:hypothetical protein